MASATRFGSIMTGRIASAIYGAAITGSLMLAGNQYFSTDNNTTPKTYVDSTETVNWTAAYTEFKVPTKQTINGSLSLSEEAGTRGGSGVLVITNPTTDYLICDGININVTTTAAPKTYVDIYFSTGSTVSATGTGVNIADNFSFDAGLHVLSGSALSLGGSSANGLKPFVLAPSTNSGAVNSIVFVSKNQTGASLAGQYDIPCRYLKD